MIVLIDGVKYKHLAPENEAELEGQIEANYKHIFGENAIYFPKKKIRSKAGIGTIPDAYLIIPGKTLKWCILEVELASHSVYDHVFLQLSKFKGAIEDSTSRKKIRDFFYNTITKDPVLEAQFRKQIGSGEIYKSISDMVEEKPLIVVAINKKTNKLEEALAHFGGDVKVVEFKTFRREGCSDEINAFVFEPAVISKQPSIIIPDPGVGPGGKPQKRPGTIMYSVYELFNNKGVDNVSYEECEAAAKKVKPDTAFKKGHFSWYKNHYRKEQKYKGRSMDPKIRSGVLPEGLKMFSYYKGKKLTADVIQNGKIRFNDKVFNSPSLAAIAAIQSTGSKRTSENGWTWWMFLDSETGEEISIDALRKR